jgi:phosphatidylserine/phosphatidylglycerophosphate/cardiolipin synthase-like enzyme
MSLTTPNPVTPYLAFVGLNQYRQTPAAHDYPSNIAHLFAPIDNVHLALVSLCSSAKLSLVAAMYGWDDGTIDALFRSKLESDIPVQLSLDKSQAGGVHEKALLAKWKADQIGNSVAIGKSSKGAISHDKMVVIDGQLTIAGSTNFSASGEEKQNNEAVIVWDAVFAAEARARIDVIHDEMLKQMLPKPPTKEEALPTPPEVQIASQK